MKTTRIVIVGAGFVGATTAYALMIGGLAQEIVLVDIDKEKAEGEAMDLAHGISYVNPVKVWAGEFADCSTADIIIITAGASQKPGETRLDLVKKNTTIFKEMIPLITCHIDKNAIILVVTNPVDILTYVTLKISGLPANKVIGSGTTLDSSRFRYKLSEVCGVDARNVHAYIIGEHGDTEVPAWSLANIAGASLDEFCKVSGCQCLIESKRDVFTQVKQAAYEIIEKKGATYYAVGLAIRRIVEAILRDENSILTVSSLMSGHYGVDNICLSLPTIINRTGIKRVLTLTLYPDEQDKFRHSAAVMQDLVKNLSI